MEQLPAFRSGLLKAICFYPPLFRRHEGWRIFETLIVDEKQVESSKERRHPISTRMFLFPR